MQYLLEEAGSEKRFINNASPLRAPKNPFVRSRSSSQVVHENLCPPGDHDLLILHAKFWEAVRIPRHHTVQSQLLAAAPVVNGKFYWLMGNQPVGWIAPEDIAAVAAKVPSAGPEQHGGKQYWLATEMLNGTQAAVEISKGLGLPVECVVLTPDDLAARVTSGAMKLPSFVEPTYGASILEWARQTCDGRLNFAAVTTSVEELTGKTPRTLEHWVRTNRQAVLSAASET
jgi:hypothetical protein